MADLVAPVKNGKLEETKSTVNDKKSTRGTGELGKDAFLQLLVCQMQNQDPLNPSSDTEYVSQLATFSQLEQLQNMATTTEKTQAYSLVGKAVEIKTSGSDDKIKYVDGVVDYVLSNGSKIKLSINGELYDYDELSSVFDDNYIIRKAQESAAAAQTDDEEN